MDLFAACITFGLSTGIPYYNIGFFYDYIARDFNGSREQVTLGFPLAAAMTIWIGPLVIARFSPRILILIGTALTCIALVALRANARRALDLLRIWGPVHNRLLPFRPATPSDHRVAVVSPKSRQGHGDRLCWRGHHGLAGSFIVKPLTEAFGYHIALCILGGMLFLSWPFVIFVMKDRPSDMGQNPDGDDEPPVETHVVAKTFKELMASKSFWLLLLGSLCSIGSIGAVNFHMKFGSSTKVSRRAEWWNGARRTASILILWLSIAGRFRRLRQVLEEVGDVCDLLHRGGYDSAAVEGAAR